MHAILAERVGAQFVRHRGIDAAAHEEQHVFRLADLRPDVRLDRLDGFRRRRLPVRNAAADLGDEILEQPLSVLGVRDFGVELHAEHAKLVVGHGGNGAIFGRPEHFETVWQRVNRIAVADPHAAVDRES